jgi:hypothetical protein
MPPATHSALLPLPLPLSIQGEAAQQSLRPLAEKQHRKSVVNIAESRADKHFLNRDFSDFLDF